MTDAPPTETLEEHPPEPDAPPLETEDEAGMDDAMLSFEDEAVDEDELEDGGEAWDALDAFDGIDAVESDIQRSEGGA